MFVRKRVDISNQAFIQVLLPTTVFPQRFGFLSVCLAQWLREGSPMVDTEGKMFEI